MSGLTYIEAVNDPGTPGRSGDDRYGFDESGGTAWVLDGATNVSALNPFHRAESSAAWFAEALSTRLIHGPDAGEPAEAYWHRVLSDVRAEAHNESHIPLDDLPLEASPVAAGVWMRERDSEIEFAWLGDCMALIDEGRGPIRLIGAAGENAVETAPAHTGLGLNPEAARHIECTRLRLKPGSDILLMSDGFYRLISPYRSHTPETLFDCIRGEDGLLGAIRALRAQEVSGAGTAAGERIRRRDDACALWLRLD